MEGVTETKFWAEMEGRTDYTETAPPGDPSHKQPPNPYIIVYANKILLTGPWYSGLLWGYASTWQIKTWMLTVSYWVEHRSPMEELEKVSKEQKGSATL
jgi:hypothetical protein